MEFTPCSDIRVGIYCVPMENLINIEKYPLDALDSERGAALVESCIVDLDRAGRVGDQQIPIRRSTKRHGGLDARSAGICVKRQQVGELQARVTFGSNRGQHGGIARGQIKHQHKMCFVF